jgi:hypothetical protein
MNGPNIERTRHQQFIEGLMTTFVVIVLLGIFLKVLIL